VVCLSEINLIDLRFMLLHKVLDPVHSLPVLHGRIGVTQLCTHDNKLYSAGRDGTYRQYRLLQSKLEVIDTKKVTFRFLYFSCSSSAVLFYLVI
jgi:hypothetical protein